MQNQSFGDTTCSNLALVVRPFLQRHVKTAVGLSVAAVAWMAFKDSQGITALIMVLAGGILPCFAWTLARKPGLPIVPILGAQTVLFYGMPLLVQNPGVMRFGMDAINAVCFDIFLFGLAVTLGWMFVTRSFRFNSRPTCHQFDFLGGKNQERLAIIGPVLLAASVAFLALNSLRMLTLLPGGAFPIIRAIADAAGIGGALIGGYFVSVSILRGTGRVIYWALLASHSILTIYNYTLFPATGLLTAMLIGVFLGRGKLPYIPIIVCGLLFSFLNLSKFDMRKRYWMEGEAYAYQELSDLPARFSEWADLSWEALTVPEDPELKDTARETQRLTERVNNLANLLEAREAMVDEGIKPFGGGSYTIIPALLIPRILWPDKPRTHEGMVALNVHFGRQTREESMTTYISWGLLPEAYANFGAIWGALICGFFLGGFAGALEFWSRPYPFTSLEALIFLSVAVQFGTSFEMVASVWLTSMFQMVIALIIGTAFFVKKTRPAAQTAT
ncbi:MAG: hypothetical protein V4773_03370 [Verrucomicrobiota bacterium]